VPGADVEYAAEAVCDVEQYFGALDCLITELSLLREAEGSKVLKELVPALVAADGPSDIDPNLKDVQQNLDQPFVLCFLHEAFDCFQECLPKRLSEALELLEAVLPVRSIQKIYLRLLQ
jgi:hypothetical protein